MARGRLHHFRYVFVLAIVLGTVRPAAADWLFTPFVGLTFKGGTTLFQIEDGAKRTHWNFGGSATLLGRGPLGAEALFVYTPGFFSGSPPGLVAPPGSASVESSSSYALMGNVVLAAPRSWNEYGLRPSVSGGFGLLHATLIDSFFNVGTFKRDMAGFNVGGGAVGFVTDRTGLRFDLRYFRNLQNTEDLKSPTGQRELHYWTTSIGVVFKY